MRYVLCGAAYKVAYMYGKTATNFRLNGPYTRVVVSVSTSRSRDSLKTH